MNRKKALKNEYLRRQLDDPDLPLCRRARIRARLGLPPDLDPEELSQPLDEPLLHKIRLALGEHIQRTDRGDSSPVSEGLTSLYYLAGFLSLFESDGFWDYSDRALDEDGSLRTEREGTIAALRRVGLGKDAQRLEEAWRGPGPESASSAGSGPLKSLQGRYWGAPFRSELLRRTERLLREVQEDVEAVLDREQTERRRGPA